MNEYIERLIEAGLDTDEASECLRDVFTFSEIVYLFEHTGLAVYENVKKFAAANCRGFHPRTNCEEIYDRQYRRYRDSNRSSEFVFRLSTGKVLSVAGGLPWYEYRDGQFWRPGMQ